jgi:hypothetical protein
MRFYIKREIEIPIINENGEEDYDYINVEFTVDGSYGNLGIGGYEYWGMKGYDEQMGWEIDDITWDREKYAPHINLIIDRYVYRNMDSILLEMDEYENF